MASLIFKELKGVSFSCASPTSTAICTNFDHRSMVRSSSGRAIDRHSPHLRDYRRSKSIAQLYQSSSSSSKPRTSSSSSYNQKKQTRLISPPGSSRYLLDDKAFFDVFPDSNPPPLRASLLRPSSSSRQQDQVVLRVSLHCKGCEGKVRRHISKMEGVRSFSIDLAEKKVTVIGDVTPLGVLNSVSKVKNAQFWPSGTSSPARASASF
ncbi:Copper chaperone domain-containing protein [Dioscorea alata]|uniref:Copper chaperone domain-containing protein n=1 Tax=Dioscorea alata TaxID=55571 RepID=A0ACB7V329_DIOAL|nr:Copper chaperone domain-containing protein [Dioscorea alata]